MLIKYAHIFYRNARSYVSQYGKNLSVGVWRDFLSWVKSLESDRSPVDDRIPWVVYSAHRYLADAVKSGSRVFEYGMGGSTLFFLDKGCDVVSVDHDSSWEETVRRQIPDGAKWQGYVVAPQAIQEKSDQDESRCRSSFPGYEGLSFDDYIQVINSYPDKYFDVILVDGRSRCAAMRLAKSKLSSSGLLILDNAERPRYFEVIKELISDGWCEKIFSGPGPYVKYEFWETRVFTPPES